MTNLIEKYSKAKERLDKAKTTRTELRVHLDSAEQSKVELEKEILKLSRTENIEEAKSKLEALNKTIENKIEAASILLDELENYDV